MSHGGLSTTRLARMHDVMSRHVERGSIPGLVTLISRRGEVHVDVIGEKTITTHEPMRRDTLFRVASLTKPVTAVAAMILVEECKLRLDEPVQRFLPELADRRVLQRIDGPLGDTVPAKRPITVRDLLSLRLGLGVIMAPPRGWPIQAAMRELDIAQGPPQPQTPPAPDEWIRRVGTLPLIHHPGERWMYDLGLDVLGVLVARAAGQPLSTFLRERIFDPLGMKDTGFSVAPSAIERLATSYAPDVETGALRVYDEARGGQWAKPPALPSGGSGLVSTIDDFLAFGAMMLKSGKHGRERILARPTVEAMTTDQITPEQKAASPFFGTFWESRGWGLGLSIITGPDSVAASPGRFGWDGGLGTSWYSDPAEDLIGILMTQVAWTAPTPPPVCLDFWSCVYQTIDD
ncbi:Beta-lactamase class C and other penicillin binding protein [Minicystis rosea]|nr:Beta-lactamase class C and other penicillin binding protein [Minicystis rosea]